MLKESGWDERIENTILGSKEVCPPTVTTNTPIVDESVELIVDKTNENKYTQVDVIIE